MDLTSSALFTLIERRLAWTDERQQIIAENIANADTPGYHPADVAPFAASLDRAASLAPVAMNAGDIPLPPLPDTSANSSGAAPLVASPDGNGVSTETQLGKLADAESMQSFAINLYGAYLGMFRTALDISGGSSGVP